MRPRAGRSRGGEGALPPWGDASDPVATTLREPQRAIRPHRDASRPPVRCGQGELVHLATGGDAPDLVAVRFGEPQRPIGPGRDPARGTLLYIRTAPSQQAI